jgi:hypothetical protein
MEPDGSLPYPQEAAAVPILSQMNPLHILLPLRYIMLPFNSMFPSSFISFQNVD